MSIASAINGYFTAVRRVIKSASSQIVEQFFKIMITAYFLSLFLPRGLEYACLALILGSLFSEIISFIYLYILYLWDRRKLRITKEPITKDLKVYSRKIFRISIPIAITSYIRSGLSTLKHLLIPIRLEKSGISCEVALSQYGIVNGIALPMLLFPGVITSSFSGILIPEFSRYLAKNDFKRMNEVITRIFKFTMLFSFLITGIFLCFSKDISLIIYDNIEIAHYVTVLAPLIIFMYIDTIIDSILKGLDEQVGVMKCNILDLFVSITFIYFLLPIFGAYGYIIVLYISEILNFSISLMQLLRKTKFKYHFLAWIIKPAICMLLTIQAFTLWKRNVITQASSLVIIIIAFIIFYFFLLLLISGISKKDIKI